MIIHIIVQSLQVKHLQGLTVINFSMKVMLGLRPPYFSCFPSAKAFPTAWPRLM